MNGDIIILHTKANFAPSAKSVVLTESFDKIANVALANHQTIILNEPEKICKKPETKDNKCVKIKRTTIENRVVNTDKQILTIYSDKMRIVKKYFKRWKTKVKEKRKDVDTTQKIVNFLEELKKHKSAVKPTKCEKRESENDQTKHCPKSANKKKYQDVSEIYKNRFQAQQDLIKSQQTKLHEQEKIIEDLKLGIITEETQKSLENGKCEIREIFKRCSVKVKCRITPPEAVEKNVDIIELRSSKVPKIMAELDKRATERAIRRNIILEKKKIIEEKKRKEYELIVASKKAADDEQKKKNLEAIKEKRRLENELERKRQENRHKYLEIINKADKFHRKKLKRKYFNAFKALMEIKNEFEIKSDLFYENLLKKKSVCIWNINVKEILEKHYLDADCLYEYKLKKKIFKSWQSVLFLQKQSMQVAEDLYDMRLQSRAFIQWHRNVCRQQMIEFKHSQIAERHYKRRILVQYFYQWKSLPAVIKLERAKEEKKRKWREKVWEIIPDYEPCTKMI
ncbi:hypothetical protein MML48_scaffold00002783 [Holotrichia oblita]|nr:hypothetical protein MML48_scaffold00002783 [Holotrichia oblita]